jgi:glycolate oxidase FAD binding subunit
VRAGTTLAELDDVLRSSGQRWPVEVAHPERATIGGTIAGAAAGPSRLRYQHPRDWIIGCRAVLGDGTLTRAGGRVVKNVTGYDLTRLYAGSYGTLVAIVELTLKLVAAPERTLTLRIDRNDAASALSVAADLRATHLPLDALAIVTDKGRASVHVRVAGVEPAVMRVAAAFRALGADDGDDAVWHRLAASTAEGEAVARAVWPAGHRPPDLDLASAVIYPGSGIAFLLGPIAPARFRAMRAALESAGGALVVERASAEYKREVGGAWGACRTPAGVAASLKERFDPNGVLAPGRMPLASMP